MMALTPHAMKIELLRHSASQFRVETLMAPTSTCSPGPVQMAAVDIDGDGLTDIAVADSACGNWYALQQPNCEFDPRSWSDAFPSAGPVPWMASWNDGAAKQRLLLSSYGGITVLERPALGEPWQLLSPTPSLPETNIGQTEVSDVSVFLTDPSTGTNSVLYQEGGTGALVLLEESGSTGTTLDPPMTFPQENVQTVRPFVALDQLKIITTPTCGQFGLGFGTFSPEDGQIPHRLQLVTFASSGYQAATLDTKNGVGLATADAADGTEVVAVLTDDGASSRTLSLYSVMDCGTLQSLSSTSFPLPSDGLSGEMNGLVILPGVAGNLPEVVSYDGAVATFCSDGGSGLACSTSAPQKL